MKLLEGQVCLFMQSEQLEELGIKQDSCFYWVSDDGSWEFPEIVTDTEFKATYSDCKKLSAFTVGELGELLPDELKKGYKGRNCQLQSWKYGNYWEIFYGCELGRLVTVEDATEAGARAKMLIYLIKNKLINN